MVSESTSTEQPKPKPEVLAEQNRVLKEILDPSVNPPLLLIIDMQNDFVDASGKFKAMWHRDISPMQAIIPRIESLANRASERGFPVVFTKIYEDGDTRSVGGKDRLLFFENVIDKADEQYEVAAQKGTQGAELAISTVPGAFVLEKTTSSALTPDLADLIKKNGIKTVIVAGVLTQRCVKTTIDDLYKGEVGVHVVTLRDCIASDNLEQHNVTLEELEVFYPPVVDSVKLQEAWDETKDNAKSTS